MLFLFLCVLLLPSVQSTAFGSASVVLTSQDVLNGVTASSLMPASKYRVYAVYASSAPNNVYAGNVVIRGADNAQFTVADLANPKSNTGYVLDENKILLAPITISDNNPVPATGLPNRVPYTIFIASVNVLPVSPVISAQLVNGVVDSGKAGLSSPSCTVLSANMDFMISDIDTATMNDMDIIYVNTVGYDVISTEYNVMAMTKQTLGSSVMISGPIATLYNFVGSPKTFGFSLRGDGVWASSLTPGASTAFLSNGFLSVDASYAMPYANDNVLTRSYDFGKETQITLNPVVGIYYPVQGDDVKFSCVKDDGKSIIYNCGDITGSLTTDTCRSIALNVYKRTVEGPRFKVQIESTSGAFATSLFIALISVLLGVSWNA